jgi:RNA polymerase sporulation-specific sigma factor
MAKSEIGISASEKLLSPEELAFQAKSGNEEAFARLASRFKPALSAMVSGLDVPTAEKEDLLQEGLIGLYKAVRLFDPERSSFPTFARLCMRSALLDHLKELHSQDPAKSLEDLTEQIPASPAGTPERILLGKEELRELMQKVVAGLSPLERRIFGLSLQGKKAPEIAKSLGRSSKSVENALYRLRKKLPEL